MSALAAAAAPSSSRRRRVLIDTDGGCDDAVAILLALRAADVEVVGLTSCFGNVSVTQATENVYTILRVFDRLDIPFFAGSTNPLVMDRPVETWPGHGANGLGDASFLEGGAQHNHEEYQKRVQAAIQPKHAAQAIVDFSRQYPGQIDLIALGPMSNLALAVRLDPDCAGRFRSLSFMGGSYLGRGNASLSGEFNFVCDPEGASVTLRHFASRIPTLCLPWETSAAASLTWDEFDHLTRGHEDHIIGDAQTRHALEASFLKKTHAKYELVQRKGAAVAAAEEPIRVAVPATAATATGSVLTADQADALNEIPSLHDLSAFAPVAAPPAAADTVGYNPCDSYAVACLLRPSLISSSTRHHVEIVCQGTETTRGAMAIDWYDRHADDAKTPGKQPPSMVTIVTGIHKDKFMNMMTEVFQPAAAKRE